MTAADFVQEVAIEGHVLTKRTRWIQSRILDRDIIISTGGMLSESPAGSNDILEAMLTGRKTDTRTKSGEMDPVTLWLCQIFKGFKMPFPSRNLKPFWSFPESCPRNIETGHKSVILSSPNASLSRTPSEKCGGIPLGNQTTGNNWLCTLSSRRISVRLDSLNLSASSLHREWAPSLEYSRTGQPRHSGICL